MIGWLEMLESPATAGTVPGISTGFDVVSGDSRVRLLIARWPVAEVSNDSLNGGVGIGGDKGAVIGFSGVLLLPLPLGSDVATAVSGSMLLSVFLISDVETPSEVLAVDVVVAGGAGLEVLDAPASEDGMGEEEGRFAILGGEGGGLYQQL